MGLRGAGGPGGTHHLASAQRFCTNLLMLLISEGILSGEGEDPVHALRRCADTEAMCACMRDTVAAECAHKCAQAPLAQSKLIAASLDLIEKHYRDPRFNLTALAAELCVTPNYLSIRFKEEMGVGFMKYLLDRQIETAKRLLADPQYRVPGVRDGKVLESIFPASSRNWWGSPPKNTATSIPLPCEAACPGRTTRAPRPVFLPQWMRGCFSLGGGSAILGSKCTKGS